MPRTKTITKQVVEETPMQVNLMVTYVTMTKYDSAMFRVLEIPEKFRNNKHLTAKLKEYEDNQYIYVKSSKMNGASLEQNRKLKLYLLFSEFTDKKGDYVLYIKETAIKDKGVLESTKDGNVLELSDEE